MSDKIIIMPYEADHVIREKGLIVSGIPDDALIDWAKKHEINGIAWSGFAEGHLVAAGGVHFYWPGVGEAWTFMTSSLHKYRFSVHKHVYRLLNDIINRHKLYRVQAVINASHQAALDWIEALGFEKEGLMKKYGPDGQDYYMYGRVK